MLANGMHLLRAQPELHKIELHPYGEHGKRFNISRWLLEHGFVLEDNVISGDAGLHLSYAGVCRGPRNCYGKSARQYGKAALERYCHGLLRWSKERL